MILVLCLQTSADLLRSQLVCEQLPALFVVDRMCVCAFFQYARERDGENETKWNEMRDTSTGT